MKSILWGFCVGQIVSAPLVLAAVYVGNAIDHHERLANQVAQIEYIKGIHQ